MSLRHLSTESVSRLLATLIAIPPLLALFFCVLLAQNAHGAELLPFAQEVEHVAKQDVSYWFIALAFIAILSWSFIVKWLIGQLEHQRNANVQLTERLIGYMERDRPENLAVMQRVNDSLDRVNDTMNRLSPRSRTDHK